MLVQSGDTFCILTIHQVKQIDTTYVSHDKQVEINDTLRSMEHRMEQAIADRNNLILSYKNQLNLKDMSMSELDAIVANDKVIQKKNDRHIKWLKIQRTTFGILAAGLAATILIMH